MKETTEWTLPRSIRLAQEQLALLDQLTKQDQELAIKVAGRVQGLNNGLTNQKGMLEGLVQGRQPGEEAGAGEGTRRLDRGRPGPPEEVRRRAAGAARAPGREREDARAQRRAEPAVVGLVQYLSAAQTLYRLSVQRPKPDIDREAGFQERDWPRIRETPGPPAAHDRCHRRPGAAALGAGPGRRAAGRTADRGARPGCRPEAGMAQGRSRRRRSTRSSTGCTRARSSPIASSAWA